MSCEGLGELGEVDNVCIKYAHLKNTIIKYAYLKIIVKYALFTQKVL